jgi:hypothetical protein
MPMCGWSHHHDRDRSWRQSTPDTEEAREARQRDFVAHAQRAGAIVLLCLLIWAMSGAGYFWPGWVLLGLGFKLGIYARSVYERPVPAEAEI